MQVQQTPPSDATGRRGRHPILAVGTALIVLSALLFAYVFVVVPSKPSGRLLLAPMIGQIEPCVRQTALPPEHVIDPAFVACASDAGSAASVIDHTLSLLGQRISTNGRYELGYTLNVPLLKYLVLQDGQWALDQAAIDRTVRTIAQSDKRLVLYLFSNHFSAFAPIEPVLAADPSNIAQSSRGSIALGKHYGMDVYPWSIARTDNSLTKSRMKVIQAFMDAICAQPVSTRDHLAAITLLGEVHHMFPDFEAGMGFEGKYLVSDYSPASVTGFRAFLKSKFRDVSALNLALEGAPYASFEEVVPPSKDIRQETLKHFWEHIDSYAGGSFPVEGWLAPNPRLTGWVKIYLNGVPIARVKAGLGRQDVRDHLPQIGTADVGWRYDLDFHALPPGIYQVSASAEAKSGFPVLLGTKSISLIDKKQSTPPVLPIAGLPQQVLPKGELASFDHPRSEAFYFYNPLAALWHKYRAQQVVDYVQFMEQPLKNSCLGDVPRYIHQLFPYPNPSWDENKYAVDASLLDPGGLHLGVSLYGEATYGQSFFGWKQSKRPGIYGVTEFHPLRGMGSMELSDVFNRHRDNGAQFLSFFLEGRGPGNRPYAVTGPTVPFLGESNTQNGSDRLYRSVQQLMLLP